MPEVVLVMLRALLVWLVVAMSPAAMSAFGDIAEAEIVSGVIDLQDNGAMIYATGLKDEVVWEIVCKWSNGQPAWILYQNPQRRL